VSTALPHSRTRAVHAVEPSASDSFHEHGVEDLFHACAADVHGYVFSLLGDRASAEDVTAVAFERLYRARSRLDRTRGTARAWLFAIARNAALDELRRRRRQPRPLAEADRAEEHDFEAEVERGERRAMVHTALATLPARERELVLLKFHGQLSNGELAQVLGVSDSNAATRVHRALTHLRESCAEIARKEVA
jgi:RNA polymerase sigma-70 factor, ECF subfamily